MRSIRDSKENNKQSGIALLMFVIVLVLSVSGYYFSKISVVDIKVDSKLRTQVELKRAKRALLNYALINWRSGSETGQLGKLPCPDSTIDNNEGSQDSSCGNAYANAIGFFPWRALGVNVPKDSSGSCFLYIVSPAYKSRPIAALNPDSYGQIQIVDSSGVVVQGTAPEDRPIAVIIAPGKVLSTQTRVFDNDSICGNDYGNIASYLDNDGTTNNTESPVDNVIGQFVGSYAGSENLDNAAPLNDMLITITQQEFWDAMESTITSSAFDEQMKVITEALAHCLAYYGSNNSRYLPMPALMNLGGGEYRKTSDYNDSGVFTEGYAGRLPYNVSNANVKVPAANTNILLKNSYCDDIDLTTSSIIDHIWFTDPDPGENALEGKYYQLWSNWKDHFFYAISKSHNPDVSPAPASDCSGGCIEVDGTKYAGIVFFAGLKNGQKRYSRPLDGDSANKAVDADNVDDKDDIGNYLENNNTDDFPQYSGNPPVVVHPMSDGLRDFSSDANPTNDIRFCITPDMTVNPC